MQVTTTGLVLVELYYLSGSKPMSFCNIGVSRSLNENTVDPQTGAARHQKPGGKVRQGPKLFLSPQGERLGEGWS